MTEDRVRRRFNRNLRRYKLEIIVVLYLLCNLGFWGLAASDAESCFNVLV
jgi:hypothetical protein